MAKVKKSFFCKNCGNEQPKWFGRCPECMAWDSCAEELTTKSSSPRVELTKSFSTTQKSRPIPISNIQQSTIQRSDMGYEEVNRVLGGGLVAGSLILLGGEPGIGKSTLSLQLALKCSHLTTLYVSGEESCEQIKIRADRLGIENPNCYILPETSFEAILPHAQELSPQIIIIDSIQTLFSESIESSPGSVSQIRECASLLMRYAKSTSTSIFIIGHITKDGIIAGPKVLEHIVDVVLQFEGDQNNIYRILRSNKNRFGSTSEIGVFEMVHTGLKEVSNPSEILISQGSEELTGVAIGATIDGIRPYLMEIQALASSAAYGTPQRTTTGFDTKRLSMLLAVIEKHISFKMISKDVFLNIAGGFKASDPGLDLAVISSIISSYLDKPISKEYCFAAEIGLSGEVRPASRTETRIIEAARLGFKRIYISSYAKKALSKSNYNIEIIFINRISEIVRAI
ncbi:MAG: DNA repair protein RadA [Rikenellaceae bacterium]